MPKYNNYAELAAAFKSGELPSKPDPKGGRSPIGYYLMLDKGGTENSLNFYDPELSDKENEERQEKCHELFSAPDDVLLMFAAMGIPAAWC